MIAFLRRDAACCAHSRCSHTGRLRRVFSEVQKVNCPEGAREAPLEGAPVKNGI